MKINNNVAQMFEFDRMHGQIKIPLLRFQFHLFIFVNAENK